MVPASRRAVRREEWYLARASPRSLSLAVPAAVRRMLSGFTSAFDHHHTVDIMIYNIIYGIYIITGLVT